ncbi:MAG: hypothetical protein O7B25_05885 [Gammaproteobacteria bacterium]|nr:hypothetical protein [Gammaproteobacteria bacterium]
MASPLIGYLLVGVVSLLGLTVALWSRGVGPSLVALLIRNSAER